VAQLSTLGHFTLMAEDLRFKDVERNMRREHAERYEAFTRLLLPLAFGGLMFLLAFEKDYATPERSYLWLVHAAWFLMLISSLSGVALQACLVWNPIRRLAGARKESHPEYGSVIHIGGEISLFERVWFWLHLGSFVAAVVALGVYKGLNL
jgi:hypothetical protein